MLLVKLLLWNNSVLFSMGVPTHLSGFEGLEDFCI